MIFPPFLAFVVGTVDAAPAVPSGKRLREVDPVVLSCIQGAASTYRIDPGLLKAMAKVESGFNRWAVGCDPDGGCGKGVMQIRYDLNGLHRYGVQPEELYDPCKNIYIGAWVLSNCFSRHGVTWDGVGCYNAKTPRKRREYAWRVYQAVQQDRR